MNTSMRSLSPDGNPNRDKGIHQQTSPCVSLSSSDELPATRPHSHARRAEACRQAALRSVSVLVPVHVPYEYLTGARMDCYDQEEREQCRSERREERSLS